LNGANQNQTTSLAGREGLQHLPGHQRLARAGRGFDQQAAVVRRRRAPAGSASGAASNNSWAWRSTATPLSTANC
jgi:hypothetical protein